MNRKLDSTTAQAAGTPAQALRPTPREEAAQAADDDEIAALRAIVEGTARDTGEVFFQSLVRHLATAIGVEYAFVAEFAGKRTRVRTLAYWGKGQTTRECRVRPGRDPLRGRSAAEGCAIIPAGSRNDSRAMSHWSPWGSRATWECRCTTPGVRYSAISRCSTSGPCLQSSVSCSRSAALRLVPQRNWNGCVMSNSFARVKKGTEISMRKLRLATSRKISNRASSRANRAAIRILGLKPDEVVGTIGMSLVADTPEAQRRVREAFASIGRGTDTAGFVLELRRKDNGRPVWVQWWSKPEPNGKYTRTVIVDITDRVLMEQEKARLQQQNQYLQEEIRSVHNIDEIIGRSPVHLAVLDKVGRVASTDATVLICGETGTGKELIARAIHSNSRRRDKPLIKLNCAALPAGLVESELFGHEKGAFTGAIARRIGRFELADGGTIFLDEIGELPLETQAKLLRVLQEHEFDSVGGTSPRKVDVRVIAATNRNLLKAVSEKAFREDLYYRLSVFPILLPPLRERSGGRPAAGAIPPRSVCDKDRQTRRRGQPGDDAATNRLFLAWQRPRAGEYPRARRHPRDRAHTGDRPGRPRRARLGDRRRPAPRPRRGGA